MKDDSERREAGALPATVDGDAEPMPLPPGDDATANKREPIDLDKRAPTRLQGLGRLLEQSGRRPLRLKGLPSWLDSDAREGVASHGWGPVLARALRGLVPGDGILVTAAAAKSGKTSFVLQLLDGLACLSAANVANPDTSAPLALVYVLSEMAPEELAARSIGRWHGVNPSIFRMFGGGDGDDRKAARDVEEAAGILNELATGRSLFARAQQWFRVGAELAYNASDVQKAREGLGAWIAVVREDLRKRGERDGRPICPVLAIDPIQRFQNDDKPATEALSDLAREIQRAMNGDATCPPCAVLLTSDATKASATGGGPSSAAGRAIANARGSYQLQHAVTVVLGIEPDRGEDGQEGSERPGYVRATIGSNRWGPSGASAVFAFDGMLGRFEPKDGSPSTAREEATDYPHTNGWPAT